MGHPRQLPGPDHPDHRQFPAFTCVHGAGSLPADAAKSLSGTIDGVTVVETVLAGIPQPYRELAIKHRELVKFALVGGTTWVIDTTLFLVLKATLLESKPLTAKVVAVVVATVVSYIMNREWSFRTRGGRDRHQEAVLFFVISAIGVAVYTAPLAVSRYVLHLQAPGVSLFTQEVADFVSGQIIGVLAGMVFRWWAFRRFVFPDEEVRRQVPASQQ
jgi:putative flippase GtrA